MRRLIEARPGRPHPRGPVPALLLVPAVGLADPTWEPETVRRTAEAVLRDPAYAGIEPGLRDVVLEWIATLVSRALGMLMGTEAGGTIGSLVILVVLGILAVLLIRLAASMRRDPERGVVEADSVGRAADEWHAEADAHEAAGRHREAVRARYRAVVAALARDGLVQEVPGRTSGEYRALVARSAPATREAFGSLTDGFEAAWYGPGPTTGEDAHRVRAIAAEVGDAVRRRLAGVAPGADAP